MKWSICISILTILALGANNVAAEVIPTSERLGAASLQTLERLELTPVDVAEALLEDAVNEAEGHPSRFAIPEDVSLSPEVIGTWEILAGGRFVLWRLRIVVPGASSLNIGFDRFRLPRGGRLVLHPANGRQTTWEFTEQDNKEHGELWTPVVLTDDLVVELTLPASSRLDYDLHFKRIGKGYRFFGEETPDKSQWCNIDVACQEGDPWRAEIRSVALYTYWCAWLCSGVMINNTDEDGTPYFLTARHCISNPTAAATMVVYWNFQSPVCGQQGGGSYADHQIGAIYRASYGSSDFSLVELEEMPDTSWKVAYSGWDRSGADAQWAVGIHHANGDEKSISFEDDPTSITSQNGMFSPGDGTCVRVGDWDAGIVEPGSSGSPLYNENHHIIGQCWSTTVPIDCETQPFPTWYGNFAASWHGGGTSSTSLAGWLGNPLGPSPTTVDLYDPNFTELEVMPILELESQGNQGGPFSPSSQDYTLENQGASTIDYQAVADVAWLDLGGSTSGSLAPGASVTITVSIGAAAEEFLIGEYNGVVSFLNLTDGSGDTTRSVRLIVGARPTMISWNLDTDPGWDCEGLWAFGEPMGGGGNDALYGFPDPTSGYTGPNVLGYNLAGNYTNYMPEFHLTTDAIDCTNFRAASLRFRRWLNVELFCCDHASVSVSNDSVNFTPVWESYWAEEDSSWVLVEYDISDIADGQDAVYIRWTMGPTDLAATFSGWNIDDIEILAAVSPAVDARTPLRTVLGRAAPNPFNPQTTIAFEIPREQSVNVVVYDLIGRQVRIIAEGNRIAGRHEVSWNGRDSAGREMPSGTYVIRLETESGVEVRKVMLIR